jgi:hypothetical protein
MPAIVTSADIDHPAAEVFAYAAVIERIFGN